MGKTPTEKYYLLLKVTLLHGCCSRFLNWANGTKSHKLSQVVLYHLFVLHISIHPNIAIFRSNTAKYGREITPYLETFHAGVTFTFLLNLLVFATKLHMLAKRYILKVSNRNTRKKCVKVHSKDTRMTSMTLFWCLYC